MENYLSPYFDESPFETLPPPQKMNSCENIQRIFVTTPKTLPLR